MYKSEYHTLVLFFATINKKEKAIIYLKHYISNKHQNAYFQDYCDLLVFP